MAILKGAFIDNDTGNYLYPQTSLDMVDDAENVLLKEDVVDPALATEEGFPADAKKIGDILKDIEKTLNTSAWSFGNYFMSRTFSGSIPASQKAPDLTINIGVSGYKPIAVLCIDEKTGFYDIRKWGIYNDKMYFSFRNVDNTATAGKYMITILYVKN